MHGETVKLLRHIVYKYPRL